MNTLQTPSEPLPASDLFGGWSCALPTVEGFYWYREEGSKPEVIFWDHEMQWVRTAGADVPMGADMTHKIEGEFWSVMLNPPNIPTVPTEGGEK